jgi:hypothetical protein
MKCGESTLHSGFTYADLLLLMKFYNVKSADKIVGKSADPARIGLMIVQAKHDFQYRMHTTEELRTRIKSAFSRMDCPKFDDIEWHVDRPYLASELAMSDQNVRWMGTLKPELSIETSGRVNLERYYYRDPETGVTTSRYRVTDGTSVLEFLPAKYPRDPLPFACIKTVVAEKANPRVSGVLRKVVPLSDTQESSRSSNSSIAN